MGMRAVCEMKMKVVMMWVRIIRNETEETIGPCRGIGDKKTIS